MLKTWPRQGAIPALVRITALSAVGCIVMTATAKLAAPPAARSHRPMAPVSAGEVGSTGPETAAAFELRPDREGVVTIDPERVRTLAIDDVVLVSPLAGIEPQRFIASRSGRDGIGSTWWRLDSAESEDSQAVLVERNGFVELWMQSPGFGGGFEWMFHAIGTGRMTPMPKAADLPGCGGSFDPPVDVGEMGLGARIAVGRGSRGFVHECSGCSALDADIAFFYTPLVLEQVESDLEAVGGDPEYAPDVIAVRCAIDAVIATVAMDNTELPFGTRPVLVSMVEFDEYGDSFLGRFAGTDDGDMDSIHMIRDEVGADACTLISLGDGGGGYCGVAYFGNGNTPGWAFNSVVWGCTGGLMFAHEFGHNLGCCHASGDGVGCGEVTDCTLWQPEWAGCCMPDASGPGTPFPSFNHGWRFVVENEAPACVCTVMAYGKTIGAGSQRIPYFSNPDVEFNGVPTGSPEDSEDQRWADNAAVIRVTMPGTAQYRCERVSGAAESGRLVAAGLGDADFFGSALASNGFFLAAGAEGHNVAAQDAGSVMLFADPVEGPDEDSAGWIQIGKLTPSDLAEGDLFGHSVAMWEDLMVVGAPYTHRIVRDPVTDEILEDHPLAGAASIWIGDGEGRYCRAQVLQPEELADYDLFGSSVAVAGDLVAIGAPRREAESGTGANHGAVWIYRRVGDVWEIETMLEGTDGLAWPPGGPSGTGGRFGSSLAASVQDDPRDVVLLIGAPREQFNYGRVHPYLYRNDGGAWTEVPGTVVTGSYLFGHFGTSVAIFGGDAIVGAPGANLGKGAGVAYRVNFVNLVNAGVLEYQNAEGDLAGTSVAINATFAAIGVPGRDRHVQLDGEAIVLEDVGAATVFSRQPGDNSWAVRQEVKPLDLRAGDAFGSSAAVVGNRLFIGASEADDAALLSGAVYVIDMPEVQDCNENGVDDMRDILVNPELDENANGVPDECEVDYCPADLDSDGVVGPPDLGILLGLWTTDGLPEGADLDGDGIVKASDLGLLIGAWGSCG